MSLRCRGRFRLRAFGVLVVGAVPAAAARSAATAGFAVRGSSDLIVVAVTGVTAAATAARAAAAHHQDHSRSKCQPNPVLRQPFHDFILYKNELPSRLSRSSKGMVAAGI